MPEKTITPEDVLNYFRSDAVYGGFSHGDFRWALECLIPLLPLLEVSASDQALTNVSLHLDDRERAWLNRLAQAANRLDDAAIVQAIGEERYHAQKDPRFGESNPELMDLAFWKLMVRRGWSAYHARTEFDSAYQEYQQQLADMPELDTAELDAMDEDDWPEYPTYSYGGAVWSFNRFGKSNTKLADGREIWIAGEHEDYYDSDFYIYNDVIVIHPNLEVKIYGYPREVFPLTDFHSATLVGEHIYIIGTLGHLGTRVPGETPVYRLDCRTYQIEEVPTTGENPGWIHRHSAEYDAEANAIKVTQGKVFLRWEGKRQFRQNRKTYWLDLATGHWSSGRRKES